MWRGARWVVVTGVKYVAFSVRNPGKLAQTLKSVLSELPTLPRRLTYVASFEQDVERLKQDLMQSKSEFEKLDAEHIDLEWLERNQSLVSSQWALETPVSPKWAVLYILLRMLKPKLVVETGVAGGVSTSYILQALADNDCGTLHSIDLPDQLHIGQDGKCHGCHGGSKPPGQPAGWLVPPVLKKRWQLTLGDTHEVLPRILGSLRQIDLFLHDSEHTYETMTFEYECVWNFIQPGGYLVSDDIDCNSAFTDFVQRQGLEPKTILGMGVIHKTV
jgi:cephalosporin hydroxylase